MPVHAYTDTHWNYLRLNGSDTLVFLHRILTQDTKTMAEGVSLAFCQTDRTGMLTSYGYLKRGQNQEVEIFYQDLKEESLFECFEKYRVLEDVAWAPPEPIMATFVWSTDMTTWNPEAFGVFQIRYRPESPVWIAFHKDWNIPTGWTNASDELWHRTRCQFGIPWRGFELISKRIPLEVGLGHGIKLDKGCYLGQETLAKFAHRAELPRQLFSVDIIHSPHPEPNQPLDPRSFKMTVGEEDVSYSVTTLATLGPGRLGALFIGKTHPLKSALTGTPSVSLNGQNLPFENLRHYS